MDALDYIEREGQANMAQHQAQYAVLMQRAQAVLLLLLGGGGALGGLALQQWVAGALSAPLLVALAAGALWWFVLAGAAAAVMRSRKLPAAHNEPGNLWRAFEQIRHAEGRGDAAALAQLRVRELQGLQQRVQQLRAVSNRVARWLNHIVMAAAATPLVVGAALWVGWA